ncbi:uncharacterized protein LOC108682648 isoform X2 [Hyalella azteca]|uniref:Uncharacterized protein LOC108682648 isoform X2 n=1 Tax=Hyalella azteca TaxID=294128 RepID=A0A8B7PPX2_HYAAZ|nr:uncharacterized protein LOC108682648 isoform X2 [Hyalella azteca]XP_047740245.1 uncharacterized protein LOC108682648 isoform X2 [Hyalella azteca]
MPSKIANLTTENDPSPRAPPRNLESLLHGHHRLSHHTLHLRVNDNHYNHKPSVMNTKNINSNHAIKRAVRKQTTPRRQVGNIFSDRAIRRPSELQYRILRTEYYEINGTTTEPDPAPGEGFNVVGVLLAVISVILIIIGIAFVYSRMRRGKLSPAADEPDMELAAPTEQEPEREKDPYMEWLNMPEEQPPTPDLRKQMKTAVRTVSRKISLAQKKEADDFKIGVPPHLRYQLKEIYVY